MYEVKRKRKKGFVVALFVFLCAFSVGLGIGYGGVKLGYFGKKQEVPRVVPSAVPSPIPDRQASANLAEEAEASPSPSPKPQGYFVRVEGNRVCAFTVDEDGEKKFSHNLPIELGALREQDQQMLLEGIMLSSKEELLSLVEDFSS